MAAAIADPKVVIRDQVGDHLVTPKNSAFNGEARQALRPPHRALDNQR